MARSKRAFRKVSHDQVWDVRLFDRLAFDDSPVIESPLVTGSDWATSAGTERATILRVRGWLSMSSDANNTNVDAAYALIYLTDVDAPILAAGSNGPADVLGYIEDVFWYGGTGFAKGNAGAVEQAPSFRLDVDTKGMRRITNDQQLRIAFAGQVANRFTQVSGVIRTLVRRGG